MALHALALALFLPRATLPASPFGFVVIDDPVQAMDPAKVDGLCRANGLDVPRASMRVKLACLRAVSAKGAGDAALAWWGLSRACHQHAYEIAPSHLEVAHLASTVRSLDAVVTHEPSAPAWIRSRGRYYSFPSRSIV